MSKGYGKIQQEVIEYFRTISEGKDGRYQGKILDIANFVFNTENPTDSEYQSITRAIRKLEKDEWVKVIGRGERVKKEHDDNITQETTKNKIVEVFIWRGKIYNLD